ncbi:exodeoxyribonuclease III [Lawsonella clevelandensis]|uniref:exodeoxyribonuclease III n=1 Tax=Lawsonella clevelandensis TaxID=1528099 RepID=UPI0023F02A44|nr:exodeoxyribonuclease III [Lawsonella clevelandensis]
MRLATWNVNSIRARVDRVTDWLLANDVDALCIQETKCKDEQFPFERFEEMGYEVAHVGYNQWNGVAIVSRIGIEDVEEHFPGQPGFAKDPEAEQVMEARAVSAVVGALEPSGPTTLWSLYIPNGRELTDRHYTYKLEWLHKLRDAAAEWLAEDPEVQMMLAGDWNVAPLDTDVWDPEFFVGKTHLSAPEREAFAALGETGFREITREFLPEPHTYTYWDYTRLSFPKDYGMRIDFAYLSPALADRVTGVSIDREERKGQGASDHVPVLLEVTD